MIHIFRGQSLFLLSMVSLALRWFLILRMAFFANYWGFRGSDTMEVG